MCGTCYLHKAHPPMPRTPLLIPASCHRLQADLDLREEKLMSDLLQLMAAARFTLISSKEWEQALSEEVRGGVVPLADGWVGLLWCCARRCE
jgi:hypothetical protein